MEERLDAVLKELVYLAESLTKEAIEKRYFDKDLAEAVCIVLSLGYGRWGKNGNK